MFSKAQISIVALLAFLLAANIPVLGSHFWVNYAQIQRLIGNVEAASASFSNISALEMLNISTRSQIAQFFVDTKHFAKGADIFLSVDRAILTENEVALLIYALLHSGRLSKAREIYDATNPSLFFHPSVAAALLQQLRFLSQAEIFHYEDLLADVLQYDSTSPAFRLLIENLRAGSSTTGDLSDRVRQTLDWIAAVESHDPSECNMRESLYTDEITVLNVASLIGIPVQSVQLGRELAQNGNFEKFSRYSLLPTGWKPSLMASGNPWNRGVFRIGVDAVQVPRLGVTDWAVRIDGITVERASSKEAARAGVWHEPIELAPETPYAVSFSYCTDGIEDMNSSLWIGTDPEVLFANDRSFPNTDGRWMQVVLVAWNKSDQPKLIQPLLRHFGEGSVWFDQFSVQEVLSGIDVSRDSALQIIR